MNYPRVEIDLNKIKHNTKIVIDICNKNNIKVVGVTKGFCGKRRIIQAMIDGGIKIIGDSRIENLKNNRGIRLPKMLLCLPMKSRVKEVVKYSDISLNSELDTIKEISKTAINMNKTHKIILMIDLGDLREGIFEENQIYNIINNIINLKGVSLYGIGTNLTCHGGVIPDEKNLGKLVKIKEKIEKRFEIDIDVISGGNSSSIYLINNGNISKQINQLRIGEGIILGRETAFGNKIKNTYDDCFKLVTEIIEIKNKPSIPIGNIGVDAFGNKPKFQDKGIIRRAICAIGKQDVNPFDIIPDDKDIEIIGASSDHLIMDVTNSKIDYRIGDVISFRLSYGGILSLMTSRYVSKLYI